MSAYHYTSIPCIITSISSRGTTKFIVSVIDFCIIFRSMQGGAIMEVLKCRANELSLPSLWKSVTKEQRRSIASMAHKATLNELSGLASMSKLEKFIPTLKRLADKSFEEHDQDNDAKHIKRLISLHLKALLLNKAALTWARELGEEGKKRREAIGDAIFKNSGKKRSPVP